MTRRSHKSSSPKSTQRQPLLGDQEFPHSTESPANTKCSYCNKVQYGEAIGGAAAECAAVCCCCPCGLVNLLILAVYKLPAGICRKALRRKRRRMMLKNGHSLNAPKCVCDDDLVVELSRGNSVISDQEEIVALEEEMWAKFYGGGFWRSPSQSQINEMYDFPM